MRTVELIYITSMLIAVTTAFPQLRRLWKMKNSDEFNLLSWAAWLAAQMTGLAYAISIASVPYVIVNLLWIVFYAVMVGLIIKYRSGGKREMAYATLGQQDVVTKISNGNGDE